MKHKGIRSIFLCLFVYLLFSFSGKAQNKNLKQVTAEGCVQPTGSTYLEINNVRALIHTGGDMWWDLEGTAKYEVPKNSGKTASFAGSIWIGAKDQYDQLKAAGNIFRSSGVDFWPGPLITNGDNQATVSTDVCLEYDRHFVISKAEVQKFRTYINAVLNGTESKLSDEFDDYEIPEIIQNWPAHGPAGGYDYYLAPFFDANDDGVYNCYDGDYPYFDLDGNLPCQVSREDNVPHLYGDQTLWWVFNDKGNKHTETGGDPLGLEFRAQAYAYSTNDDLDNCTFYNYQIINRSTETLYETYFGLNSSADIGYAFDDYIGCDVSRGLGYVYNGKTIDGDGQSYAYGGPNPPPPAFGIDFIKGPYMDNNYGTDRPSGKCDEGINGSNFGDGIAGNERLGMQSFINFCHMCPNCASNASDIYYLLQGKWQNGMDMTYGNYGISYNTDTNDVVTRFLFPGSSDTCGWGQGGIVMPPWSEITENNPADDRRFLASTGPFTLEPGEVNDVTLGAIWARATSGDNLTSVEALQRADDKAQALFDNCFRILDGPDAPELNIIEMENKLVFYLDNPEMSNNFQEKYSQEDPTIILPENPEDSSKNYVFEGYKVYQLRSPFVTVHDFDNPDSARLVFQCDIKNDVSKIINYEWDYDLNANIPIKMVDGENKGLRHSFELTEDLFAGDSTNLVNYKKYYYVAIAYAYNNYLHYSQNDPQTTHGQKNAYIASRKSTFGQIEIQEAMPHPLASKDNGTVLNCDFGSSPKITQIEGHGNANNILELTQESLDEIMSGEPWKIAEPTYEAGYSPIEIKIIDPLNLPADDYTLVFDSLKELIGFVYIPPTIDSSWFGLVYEAEWEIENSAGVKIRSDKIISIENEQIIPEWGFSVKIQQTNLIKFDNQKMAHLPQPENHGLLHSEIVYSDSSKMWLDFIYDTDDYSAFNWIRVGKQSDETQPAYNDYLDYDENEIYETVLNGSWAPYKFSSVYYDGPAWEEMRSIIKFNESRLPSIDVVFTPDKSKWTRCVVVEMADNDTIEGSYYELSVDPDVIGSVYKFDKRMSPSVDKEGNFAEITDGASTNPNSPNYISSFGMGWFPGYAIDVGTGERLNIMFGEDSRQLTQNGRDMLWNPTSAISKDLYQATNGKDGQLFFGGKHYIYIMGHNHIKRDSSFLMPTYDEGKFIDSMLTSYDGEPIAAYEKRKKQVYRSAAWVSLPMLADSSDLLSSEIKVKIRVANPYRCDRLGLIKKPGEELINNGNPAYRFSTKELSPETGIISSSHKAFEKIKIVPNPYLGFCENGANLSNGEVKITNLPQQCNISIFTSNGTLIRRIQKNDELTFCTWDLKNNFDRYVSMGTYIIHIKTDGVGEKVIKWFGAPQRNYLMAE